MLKANEIVKYTLKHVDRLVEAVETAVATGHAEAVHAVRVTSRRLNEPLTIMSHWVGRSQARRAARGLKKIRKSVGAVRDYDVLSHSLLESCGQSVLSAQERSRLEGLLLMRRESAFASALERLLQVSPDEVAADIRGICDTFQRRFAEKDVKRLSRRIAKAWRKRAQTMLKKMDGPATVVDLHEVRIDLKALRYCTELIDKLDDRDGGAHLEAFTRMQDRLGAWNDELFAATALGGIATEPGLLSGDAPFAARILHLAAQRAMAAAMERDEVLLCWPAVRSAIESAGHRCGRRGVRPAAAVSVENTPAAALPS